MANMCVAVVEAGQIRHGLWCPGCLLAARVEVDVLMLTDSGVTPLGVYAMCATCGEYRPCPRS